MEMCPASTSKNAAVASARACLDVLRGAAVLIDHNKEALVELLTARGQYGAASGEQELVMLQGLGRHVSEIIELCTQSSERTSGVPPAPPEPSEGVAGMVETLEVTDVPTKRHREQAALGDQQRPHHHQSAAAATVRQSSSALTAKTTVLTTAELLVHIMGCLGGGSGRVWDRREELGGMALVCRAWRDAAHSEVLWGPLAKELIPRLADEDLAITQDELRTAAAGSYRQYLMRCGQLTMETKLLDGVDWATDLILQCEVWDVDGFCMFSTESAVSVESDDDSVELSAWDTGPTFSVASRSAVRPGDHPPQTMLHFLEAQRWFDIRMTVHHKRTRNRAAFWTSRKLQVDEVIQEGHILFVINEQRSLSSVLYGHDSLDVTVGLRIQPCGGINGSGDAQTLWRVTCSFMRFESVEQSSVQRLIWSVLQ